MSTNPIVKQIIGPSLSGKGAHVEAFAALDGLDWKLAGVRCEGVPYSVFQLVNHVLFWQDWVVNWFDGANAPIPRHASGGWPGRVAPASAREWKQKVIRFQRGIENLEGQTRRKNLLAKRGKKTFLQMLQTISSHNSYHIGQIVLLRQMLEAWPPPSGGLTW